MDQYHLILRALLVLLAGGVGLYLMLPRGPVSQIPFFRWGGAALVTLSFLLLICMPMSPGLAKDLPTTFFWKIPGGATNLTFWLLAVVTLSSAVLMITSRNPVYTALWFALVLLSNSGLYLLQNASFLAGATIIVYAGAIIITFLFVIMLAQPGGAAPYDHVSREPLLACTAGVLLAGILLGTIHFGMTAEAETGIGQTIVSARPSHQLVERSLEAGSPSWRIDPQRPHVESLGRTLFLDHYVSVEVIGVLLLSAVVGAMLIATHRIEGPAGKGGK